MVLQETKFSNPARVITDEEMTFMKLRYYNAAVHRAAFVLPQFAAQVKNSFALTVLRTMQNVFLKYPAIVLSFLITV